MIKFRTTDTQQAQPTKTPTDRPKKAHKYKNLYEVPNLNWPKFYEIPPHLLDRNNWINIIYRTIKRGQCWGCGGKHNAKDCDPKVLKRIPICNGSPNPTCRVRHEGYACPFVGENRWMDGNGNMYETPGGRGRNDDTCNSGNNNSGGDNRSLTKMLQTRKFQDGRILNLSKL